MTQGALFMQLFFSVILTAAAAREIARSNFGLGVALVAIPVCYWLSVYYGVPQQ